MIHNTESGGQHNVSETTAGQHVLNPLLHILHRYIETWGNNTSLVQATNELHNDLAIAVIIKNLKLTKIS